MIPRLRSTPPIPKPVKAATKPPAWEDPAEVVLETEQAMVSWYPRARTYIAAHLSGRSCSSKNRSDIVSWLAGHGITWKPSEVNLK